jgi:hypothetical protein
MGSPLIAALIAHLAFWFLLAYGYFWSEISARGLAVFLTLWFGGLFELPYIPYGAPLLSSYVALLDIALVFAVFKGDLPLT